MPKEGSDIVRISITLPREMVGWIDDQIEKDVKLENVTQVIRWCIRAQMEAKR
jgi:Arc/MetJ-type ribon-helix-helix transcriptional regulator